MGWLYQNDPLRHETPAQYLTRMYNRDEPERRQTVLASATVRGTVYQAIKVEERKTGRTYVLCAVTLIRNSKRHGFGYKDMDETMGPVECDCPERVLRLLSPIEDIPHPGYAADWRARVREAQAARARARQAKTALTVGTVLRAPREISFTTGWKADAFRVVEIRKRTPIFVPLDDYTRRCRLPPRLIAACTIERPQA